MSFVFEDEQQAEPKGKYVFEDDVTPQTPARSMQTESPQASQPTAEAVGPQGTAPPPQPKQMDDSPAGLLKQSGEDQSQYFNKPLENAGPLTKAAKTITDNFRRVPEQLVGIHDKELSWRQGSEMDWAPELRAGTKESTQKLEKGVAELNKTKGEIENYQPPKGLTEAAGRLKNLKGEIDKISGQAVDNRLPADALKKYSALLAQHHTEAEKYNRLVKGMTQDRQAKLDEYNIKAKELTARQLRIAYGTPDQEEKSSIIQHIVRAVGADKALGMDEESATKRRTAIENAQAAIERVGGKSETDDTLMQLVKSAGNESALGLPKAILEAQGEKWEEPKNAEEKVAAGVGQLLGFITGVPGGITREVAKGTVKLFPKLAVHGGEGAVMRGAKMAALDAPSLASGFASAAIGEALSQNNIDDALKVMSKAAASGAVMGTTFAGMKGIIPGDAPLDKIKRIATGLAVFDLERGNQPFDERKLNEKIVDYGLDAYFLWHGLPKQERGLVYQSMEETLKRMNDKTQQKADWDNRTREPDYAAQAKEVGVRFDGMQGRKGKPALPMFTDIETGLSIMLGEDQNLHDELAKTRKQFADAKKEPWQMTQLEMAKKINPDDPVHSHQINAAREAAQRLTQDIDEVAPEEKQGDLLK